MAIAFDLTTMASIASDVFLGVGAAGAAIYCMILARRLKKLSTLKNGVGGAVAVLSAQVDDMTKTLEMAQKSAKHSQETLTALTDRAEASARKLELMMASLHDLPEPKEPRSSKTERAQDEEWEEAQKPPAPVETSEEDNVPLFSTKRGVSTEAA